MAKNLEKKTGVKQDLGVQEIKHLIYYGISLSFRLNLVSAG